MTNRSFADQLPVEEVEARLDALEALSQAMSSNTVDEFILLVMETLNRRIPAECGLLLLVDDAGTQLKVCGSYRSGGWEGEPLEYSLPIVATAGQRGIGLSVQALLTGQPYYWNVASSDPVHIPELAQQINARESLAVPLAHNGQSVGVFHITNSQRGGFTESDTQFLVAISTQVAAMLSECCLREALERKNRELEKSMAIHEDFVSAAVRGDDPRRIAGLLATLLGLGVVVQDRALNVLSAVAANGESDQSLGEVVNRACASVGRDRLAARLRQAGRGADLLSIPLPDSHSEQEELVGLPILAGRHYLGILAVVANRPLSALDTVAVSQAAGALALRLTQEQHDFMTLEKLRGGLLYEIVRDDFASEVGAHERAALLGYSLSPPFRIMVIEWGKLNDDRSFLRLNRDSSVCQRLTQTWPGLLPSRQGKSIVILASGDLARDSDRVARGVVKEMARYYPDAKVWCGIGGPCVSLSDAKASYQQAKKAVRVGRELQGEERVFDYERLGVFRLLTAISPTGDLDEFVESKLGALLRHDEDKGANLVQTLKVYFHFRGSKKSAAKELSIHLNTLQYRLKRVEELCGVCLDDHEAAFELNLALKALSVVRAALDG